MQDNSKPIFHFQARWKEELVVTCLGGEFILEFPMGIPTIYLPTEEIWRQRAPLWARDIYLELKAELGQWCVEKELPLYIETNWSRSSYPNWTET